MSARKHSAAPRGRPSRRRTGTAPAEVRRRARHVRMVLMDCDGVMTDGSIMLLGGNGEAKSFDSKDGIGMRVAQNLGLVVGIVTGRRSEAVRRRARELGLREIHQKVWDKLKRVRAILRRKKIAFEELCFIGDDIVDLPVLLQAGLAVAPADAHPEVLKRVHWVTRQPGGRGMVREVLDTVIKARGLQDKFMEPFLR